MRGRTAQRLAWIAASLRYGGSFGAAEKKDYAYRFDIGESQVGRDQEAFLDFVEDQVGSDVVRKEKGKLFLEDALGLDAVTHILPVVDLPDWLRATLRHGYVAPREVVRAPPCAMVVREVVLAILRERPLSILYRSRKSPEGVQHLISPHTIVDVAGRYHVRAFDHHSGRWSDFVMTRMEWALPASVLDRGLHRKKSSDLNWAAMTSIEIRAKIEERNQAVARDFGLDEDFRRVERTRVALAPYLVDPDEDFSHPVEVHYGRD